ncbi:phosphopantetheine adenylyltransferase [Monosporozyma servazzii]
MVCIGFVLDQIDCLDIDWLNETVDNVLTRDHHSLEKLLQHDNYTSSRSAIDILLLLKIDSTFHLDDLLGKIYSNVREILMQRGLSLLPLNVLLGNFNKHDLYWDHIFVHDPTILEKYDIQFGTVEKFNGTNSHVVPSPYNHPVEIDSKDQNKYSVSALGGTFDHIHDGHKILLSMSAFLTSERLIVGLTDEELLVNKKYKEYLEPFSKRKNNVIEFIRMLKPQLNVEIIPLHDVCGPTGTVPEIECLIVSRETVKGGDIVNKTRAERGLSKLDIVVVNVLGGDEDDGWKEKLSSTEVRKILATQTDSN